jgi:hypothetical protein
MKTMVVEGEISADRILRLAVPCDLEPGRVQVVLSIPNEEAPESQSRMDYWRSMSGLGRELWEDVDPMTYLNELREDREYE